MKRIEFRTPCYIPPNTKLEGKARKIVGVSKGEPRMDSDQPGYFFVEFEVDDDYIPKGEHWSLKP